MQRLVDTCLFTLSFWLAYQLRTSDWLLGDFGLGFLGLFGGTKEIEPFADFYPFLILTVPLSLVLLESQGFYRRPVLVSRMVTAWQLIKACALTTMGLILVAFLLKTSLARAVFILFGLTSFLSVFLGGARRYLYAMEAGYERIIVVGTSEDVEQAKGMRLGSCG